MAVEAQRRADELDAVFTVMVDAVLVYDATASCCGENPAAAKMLGATTLEQLNAARLAQLGRIRSTGGEHVATDDLPFSHALRGEIVRDRQFIVGNGEDGRKLTMLASASPLIVGSSVSGAVSVWHDVTERARLAALEERQHLARAGEPPVPLEFKQAIYRIALEGMRNAAKHSHANQLALRLRCCNDSVMLEVSDDGVGFDPAKPYPGHLGLSSNRWSLRRARRRLR